MWLGSPRWVLASDEAHPGARTVCSEICIFSHHLLPLPYSVLVLVSGKIFLPGGKENHQQIQAYTDLYQGILEKTMSSSFPEIISNPQRTLKSALWVTCWWRNLTIWLTALPEYEECGKGRSQGKMAFIRRKENGGWVVKGRCPSSSALPVTLNLNH